MVFFDPEVCDAILIINIAILLLLRVLFGGQRGLGIRVQVSYIYDILSNTLSLDCTKPGDDGDPKAVQRTMHGTLAAQSARNRKRSDMG